MKRDLNVGKAKVAVLHRNDKNTDLEWWVVGASLDNQVGGEVHIMLGESEHYPSLIRIHLSDKQARRMGIALIDAAS